MSRPLDSFPDVSKFPDIPCPGRVALLKSIPTGRDLERARDWPFMSPEEYDRKWNAIQGPETDPLAAEQAASIASNLEVESGTDENEPVAEIPEITQEDLDAETRIPKDEKWTENFTPPTEEFDNPFVNYGT